MSSWMNDAAVQNQNGTNGFPQLTDPNAVAGAMMDPSAFMGSPAQFNPAAAQQFANHQQMVAMQNGVMRNASPSFQNPMYQTNPVIPSKRPRPREDSLAGSPPPPNPAGMMPTSRSETPQQAQYANFPQGGIPQQNAGQPSPYPHLQPNGSANATPSPIMGNQMRPGSVPQRVSTASPHPFSPAAQQFGLQASPISSDQTGTPQQQNPYMQGNFPQGFNQNFTPTPSPARPSPTPNNAMAAQMAGQMMPQQMGQMPQQMAQPIGQMGMGQMGQMPNQMYPQQMPQARNAMEQQKLIYQMQLQRQLQQSNLQISGQMSAAQTMAQNRNMMARQQMPNGQMAPNAMAPQQQGMPQQQQPQQQQQAMPRKVNPEQFMQQLTVFMRTKGLPLEISPMVENRPVNLMALFQTVSKFGGYRNVTQTNLWPQVSNMVGFNPMQSPAAPPQIKAIYERNLLKFDEAWAQNRSKMMQAQQQQGMQSMANMSNAQGTPAKQMSPQNQMQPGQMMQPGPQPHMQQGPGQIQTPIKQMPPGSAQASVNGFATPQHPHPQQANATPGHSRNSLSKSHQATPTNDDFPMPSPASAKRGSMSLPGAPLPDGQSMSGHSAEAAMHFPAPFAGKDEYIPCHREYTSHGGVSLRIAAEQGVELEQVKPNIPAVHELGNIDIHALTKSIQSGIHGEVRLALDILAQVTASGFHQLEIDLSMCDDLVETLVECAEDQIEMLAEHTVEVSDEILINPYEDVIRSCRLEKMAVHEIPVFGSQEYDLDRAVDRLICITTILRNLSFAPVNQIILADEIVIKFLCVVIRYLGTRNTLLRTHANTLDFMKDVVTFLSNIAASVEIPGREQALCLLQFVLAFAPTPVPTMSSSSDKVFFTSFDPVLHPYLPAAVDVLAKLFARDEPNRSHYKAIITLDGANSPPYELLTRTFALAIAPIPDQAKDNRTPNLPSLVEARKPCLMQGLLAADIIASLAPGYESGVTRTWLSSVNGFAQNLFRLIRTLSAQFEAQQPRPGGPQPRGQIKKDTDLVYIVVLGVSMLRKLAEKARDPNDPTNSIPPNVLPSGDSVLGALSMSSVEWTKDGLLGHLVAYAGLED